MVLSQREVVIGVAGVAVGVVVTLGVQKGIKTLKTRSARLKAAKLANETADEPGSVKGKVVDTVKNVRHEKVDIVVNTALGKLPNETDEDYKKRMDNIIAQAEEAKHGKKPAAANA
jgi:hypothetical protein